MTEPRGTSRSASIPPAAGRARTGASPVAARAAGRCSRQGKAAATIRPRIVDRRGSSARRPSIGAARPGDRSAAGAVGGSGAPASTMLSRIVALGGVGQLDRPVIALSSVSSARAVYGIEAQRSGLGRVGRPRRSSSPGISVTWRSVIDRRSDMPPAPRMRSRSPRGRSRRDDPRVGAPESTTGRARAVRAARRRRRAGSLGPCRGCDRRWRRLRWPLVYDLDHAPPPRPRRWPIGSSGGRRSEGDGDLVRRRVATRRRGRTRRRRSAPESPCGRWRETSPSGRAGKAKRPSSGSTRTRRGRGVLRRVSFVQVADRDRVGGE